MVVQIYVVQIGNEPARLIEATSKKAAIQHALPVVVVAEKATPANVAQLMANGVKVESAEG